MIPSGGWWKLTVMSSRDDLAEQREQWITTICTGLVKAVDKHPALDPVRIASELGDVRLVRALMVGQIAALAASGCSSGDIGGLLTASPAFVASRPEREQLTDLANKIRWCLEFDGLIVGSAWLLGCGLRAWSPEGTFQFLLELWSVRHLGSLSRTQARRELERCWNVQDLHWLESCLSGSADPLQGYPDVWATLKAEPDFRASNAAALALGHRASNRAWERWVDRLPLGTAAGHLRTIGGDLVHCTLARPFLRRVRDQPDLDRDLRPVMIRAMKIIDNHLEHLKTVVNGLSAFERELMVDRTDDQYFQDQCLTELGNWSCNVTTRSSWGGVPDAAHGWWGPLPWWTITVQDDDQQRAANAALDEGTLPLGFEHDPTHPERLGLMCRKPRTGSPGMRADFTFDLSNPAHAGELLAIGRRGNIRIDVLKPADYELDDPQPVLLGTLRVTAGNEVARMLTELASTALKDLLPAAPEAGASCYEFPALGAVLRQVSPHRLDTLSSARKLLSTESRTTGRITLETSDPATSMARFAAAERAGRSSFRRTEEVAAKSHETGFVYVQQNPGIPGMLKVGYSQRLPEDRASELSCTPVPFPFEVQYRRNTSRAFDVEQAVHRLLAVHRVAPNREFFRVHQETAEEAIRYCQELETGISRWKPMPALHQLRAGDRVTLPLKAHQLFVTTAFPDLLAPAAKPVDIWQAHADGDVLELYVTDDPGMVSGFSDNDPGATEDPVPYLNRDNTAPNGLLIGRERLMAGDRLSWLSDEGGTSQCTHVVFEIHGFCQVTCRTWNPQTDPNGMPLLLNYLIRKISPEIRVAVQDVLALESPRTWAPRNPDQGNGWARPATQPTQPDQWLSQLQPRQRHRPRQEPG